MNLPQEIARKVNVMASGCWEWQAARHARGYGSVGFNKKMFLVHRLVYLWANGPLRPGEDVMHTCDNPPCCNPVHLKAGTRKDNMQDCKKKGRLNPCRGTDQWECRLTPDDVRMVRILLAKNERVSDIARMYGVGYSTIGNIKHNRTWNHLVALG